MPAQPVVERLRDMPGVGMLGERMARHGFADRPGRSAAAAAALTCAIQAQDAPAAWLGVRARSANLTEAGVLRAVEEGRVVRTWLMRGTIHLVDVVDLRWLVRLIGPSIQRKYRSRWRQIGLSDELLGRVVDALPDVLADGPLPRRGIRARLIERGVRLDSPDPQAMTHALVHASTIGLLCRGAGDTFALLDSWAPDAPEGPSEDDALAELARRYFAAYSPATTADFAAWSGLAGGRAILLIKDELAPVDLGGRPGWRLGSVEPARGLRLLPAFDNYLIGYRHRDAILSAELRPRIYAGGLIHPSVLHDGAVIGKWSLQRPADPLRVVVEPFGRFSRTIRGAVEEEVADIGRFLGRGANLDLADP
jgi:hypothetical protein